jgi:hypothetical protein
MSHRRNYAIPHALRAPRCIAECPEGAQAVVDADVFDVLPDLMRNSPNAIVRYRAANTLETLATRDFGKVMLNSNLCTQLVAQLR